MADDGGVKINVALLLARAGALSAHLTANAALWNGAGALQLVHGKRKEKDDLFVVSAQVRCARARARAPSRRAGRLTPPARRPTPSSRSSATSFPTRARCSLAARSLCTRRRKS